MVAIADHLITENKKRKRSQRMISVPKTAAKAIFSEVGILLVVEYQTFSIASHELFITHFQTFIHNCARKCFNSGVILL
jgi:hypothetical protein